MFLIWAKITSVIQRINLKFVVRLNVQNEDTNDVVSEALKKVGVANGVPPAWPGYTFKPDVRYQRDLFTHAIHNLDYGLTDLWCRKMV